MWLYATEHNPGSLGRNIRYVTAGYLRDHHEFTPLIEASTEEDRPTADEAKEAAAREQAVLVDGFLAPTKLIQKLV